MVMHRNGMQREREREREEEEEGDEFRLTRLAWNSREDK
jgi:hypothetical protein